MSETRNGQFTRSMNFATSRDSTQPRFHFEEVMNEAASAAQGRPIYVSEERVQFLMPGSPNQPVFRVNDEHRQRWPEQYAAFKKGEEHAVDGTPLEQWPLLTRAMVLELKGVGILTVEQCADLPDALLHRINMAGRQIRDHAKAYLDDAAAIAFATKLERENDALHARVASAERQVEEMRELLERIHSRQVAELDRPHPIATYVQHEQQMTPHYQDNAQSAGSSLDSLPPVRRGPGRPRKEPAEAMT